MIAREATDMIKRVRITPSSGNVFFDMGFSKPEAENLRLRSDLMIRITDYCCKSGKKQAVAAKSLGLSQRRLNALLKGDINQFNLDALVMIASRAGMNVRLVVKKAA